MMCADEVIGNQLTSGDVQVSRTPQQALALLLKQIGQTTDPGLLRALAHSIQPLPAKLTEAQAQRALAPLLKQIGQTTDVNALPALAQAVQALAAKLTEAQAQRALIPVLRQFGQTTNSDALRALAQAVQALASKLTEAQAQQALALLLKQIGQRTDPGLLRALAQAIPALAVKLTEAPAQQALTAVMKQIDQTTDPYLVRALAQTIQARGLVGMLPHASYIELPVPPGSEIDREQARPDDGNGDGTAPDDGWGVFSGTSAAAPQLAGACALLVQKNPGLSPSDAKAILRRTSRSVVKGAANPASSDDNVGEPASTGDTGAAGAGLVDAFAAWQQL